MNIFKSDTETIKSPDGGMILRDTQDSWDDFSGVVNRDIQRELLGMPASGGGSWNNRWLSSIKALNERTQQNYERYIEYIINERKKHGLPNINGL